MKIIVPEPIIRHEPPQRWHGMGLG